MICLKYCANDGTTLRSPHPFKVRTAYQRIFAPSQRITFFPQLAFLSRMASLKHIRYENEQQIRGPKIVIKFQIKLSLTRA